MSLPLLKIELRSNYKIVLLFFAVITLYGGVITGMYDPELEAGINMLVKSMPQIFSAFGMENPGTTLIDFLINYLYGFILVLIPFIYTILMCYKLVAKYIDKGSMAYLLNTHYTRTQIIRTQFVVLLTGLFLLVLYAAGLIAVCSRIMHGESLEIERFLFLNFGLLILELFLASLCFMFSCIFNELKFSVGLGAGLGLVFFLLQMLAQAGDGAAFLKYLTPLTLFNPERVVEYRADSIICLGVLAAGAVLFLAVGILVFKKKDLSL